MQCRPSEGIPLQFPPWEQGGMVGTAACRVWLALRHVLGSAGSTSGVLSPLVRQVHERTGSRSPEPAPPKALLSSASASAWLL